MIDIVVDKSRQPSLDELSEYVGNRLFDELCAHLRDEYQALYKIEFSGENAFLGWNVKFYKAGRTLCRVYPRKGRFIMLLVVGQKEKLPVEMLLPTLSDAFQSLYLGTREAMGQRWLMPEFDAHTALYDDMLKLIRIRREGK